MKILFNDNYLQTITEEILFKSRVKNPLVIAVDGGSGAGKSTIVQSLAKHLEAVIIPLDDFYAANISNEKWDKFSVNEKLENIFLWESLLTTVIRPLLAGANASWTTYDFSGIQNDGTYTQQLGLQTSSPSKIIIIEGAYSASPAIINYIDITILIEVSVKERHNRLTNRESPAFLKEWHKRWDSVEDYYFNDLRPGAFFDFVIKN